MIGFEDILIGNLANNVSHENTLKKLSRDAKRIEIICPFISVSGIEWLLEAIQNSKPKVVLITEFSVDAFLSGVQSIEAIEKLLLAGCQIKFLTQNLHAKVYRFDGKNALITSANMTYSGLNKNFEIGVCLSPGIINPGVVRNASEGLKQYIDSLFTFISSQAKQADMEIVGKYKVYAEQSKVFQKMKQSFEFDNPFQEYTEPYIKFDRNVKNTQNLQNDLLQTSIFDGFNSENWDVFKHSMEPNKENITKFRYQLNDKINPILKKFFTQLKSEPCFKQNLDSLQEGYSQHVQLTTRFPTNRYMYLTKNEKGKRANKHVGIPSYIVGMGEGGLLGFSEDNFKGSWLEVRTGVEEDYFTEITEAGSKFLKNLLLNKDEVLKRFKKLGSRWHITHGSYSEQDQKRIELDKINEDFLKNLVQGYLSSGKPADLHIRRLYLTDDENDRQLLFSSKITRKIAEDLNELSYFFELAHGKV